MLVKTAFHSGLTFFNNLKNFQTTFKKINNDNAIKLHKIWKINEMVNSKAVLDYILRLRS